MQRLVRPMDGRQSPDQLRLLCLSPSSAASAAPGCDNPVSPAADPPPSATDAVRAAVVRAVAEQKAQQRPPPV